MLGATFGLTKVAILHFAVVAVIVIAVAGALSAYAEKYLTTSVGQWVMHDLRRILYHHIQRLSLAYHDQKPTGDLISTVTADIDSIQDFISQALLGIVLVGPTGAGKRLSGRTSRMDAPKLHARRSCRLRSSRMLMSSSGTCRSSTTRWSARKV